MSSEQQMRDRHLTAGEAAACLQIVSDWIGRKAGPGWEPALYPPGQEGDYWNISLELGGAVGDWPYLLSLDESVAWPVGTRVEAGSPWSLSLIREN